MDFFGDWGIGDFLGGVGNKGFFWDGMWNVFKEDGKILEIGGNFRDFGIYGRDENLINLQLYVFFGQKYNPIFFTLVKQSVPYN